MKRYRNICSICLATILILGGAIVAQGADIGGTTYNSNATLTNGDTWTSGNVTINGVTVTVPGAATVTFDSTVGRSLYGTSPGTFLVADGGTFKIATTTSNDNLAISSPVKFDNQGTFEFASGGDLQLNNSGAVFENTGLIHKSTSGGGNEPSYIFRTTASTGKFVNNGGDIQVDAGILEILGGESSGGTFTTNAGRLQLSDYWTGFSGTAVGSPVYINSNTGTSGFKFVAAQATTVVNVADQGLKWDGDDIDTSGNVLQNDGLFTIGLASTGDLFGGGTFLNSSSGTLDVQNGTVNLSGSTAFENEGAMTFTTSNAKGFSGTGTVLNTSGGTADWQAGTIDLGASVTLKNEGTFSLTTTEAKTLSGTGTFENASGGTMNWQAGQLTLNNGLTNNGTFNLTTSATKTLSGTGAFENASGATMNWQTGNLTLNNDLVNEGTFEYSDTASNTSLGGSGEFINNGTFIHSATGNDNIDGTGSGSFVNNGLFDFTNNGDFELGENYTFVNTGTVRKSAGTGNETLFFTYYTGSSTTASRTFDNQGTVEVLVGELEFTSGNRGGTGALIVPQYDSGALTGGTWIVDASSSGSAILDLVPANAGIDTIGADAKVKLAGAGSVFSQINNVTTVDGAFYVNGTRSFTLASGFTVSATGILGGDGTFVGDADILGTLAPGDEGSPGIVTFESVVDLTDGTFQVDIDGPLVGLDYDQLAFAGTGPHELILSNTTLDLDVSYPAADSTKFVIVDGFDTLSGIFAGLTDGSSFIEDGVAFYIHYNADNITLTVVPEPSTVAMLLGLGAVGLLGWMRRRRRR